MAHVHRIERAAKDANVLLDNVTHRIAGDYGILRQRSEVRMATKRHKKKEWSGVSSRVLCGCLSAHHCTMQSRVDGSIGGQAAAKEQEGVDRGTPKHGVGMLLDVVGEDGGLWR